MTTLKRTDWIPHNAPYLDQSDQKAVDRAIASKWIAEGEITRRFERKMAGLLQRKFAKATSSGTSALHLALLALGIKPGDEVIASTYICTAILNAIAYVGAKPRLADIDIKNLGPAKSSIQKLIARRTRAIIVNHAFGFPADIEGIKTFGIPVIEDCAQALGGYSESQPLGSFGDLSICSFYATKMMTTGYGGMVLTDQPKLANKIADLTQCDQRPDYKVRYNYAISDISSALGLSQLQKLPFFLKRRRFIADNYQKALRSTDLYFWCGEPEDSPNFYRFIAGGPKPASFYIQQLERNKIRAISPLQPYQLLHRYLGLSKKNFPAAEFISRSAISLSIYPSLKDSEISRICRCIALLK